MRALTLALAALALPAAAQDGGAVLGGLSFADDGLPPGLEGTGPDLLGADGVGGGVYAYVGRLVGGAEAHSQRGGRHVTLNAGFDVVARPGLRAYPLVGLGVGETAVRLDGAPGAGVPLGLDLSRRQLVFNVGAGLDALVPFAGGRGGRRGLALGVRAGYLAAADAGGAALPADLDAGGSLTGPYVRVLVGFGWASR